MMVELEKQRHLHIAREGVEKEKEKTESGRRRTVRRERKCMMLSMGGGVLRRDKVA